LIADAEAFRGYVFEDEFMNEKAAASWVDHVRGCEELGEEDIAGTVVLLLAVAGST
jgi:hypothetical protein